MMENFTCFNCRREIAADVNFCPFCLTQIKCRSCNAVLIKGSIGCSDCGAPVVSTSKNDLITELNQIEFEQKGDLKKFKASFSNEVGHTLVETFGATVGGGNLQAKRRINPFLKVELPAASLQKPLVATEELDFEEDSISEELAKIFNTQDDGLVLINPRLKQTSKLDNAIRLAILAIYAYEQTGKSQIERKVLSTILKSAKLNIPVFSTWINKCDEILKNGNKVQLSVPGKTVALEILKEIADPAVIKGQIQFSRSGANGKRRRSSDVASDSNENNSTSTRSTSKQTNQSYTIVTDLNLVPAGKVRFKDFFASLKTKNHAEHILAIVYYLQKEIGYSSIGINSVYTCYKETVHKVPNIESALENIRHRKGYIETKDYNNLTVTRAGENHLEHDLRKRSTETSPK